MTTPTPPARLGRRPRGLASQLRAAREDGRLDSDELEERLGKVYAAKTYGELAPLTADLGTTRCGGRRAVRARRRGRGR